MSDARTSFEIAPSIVPSSDSSCRPPTCVVEEDVRLRRPFGDLEAILSYAADAAPRAGVVLLAPHPRYGGDMQNRVLRVLAESLASADHLVLRFDYHGVGRSAGVTSNALESFRYWSAILARGAQTLELGSVTAGGSSMSAAPIPEGSSIAGNGDPSRSNVEAALETVAGDARSAIDFVRRYVQRIHLVGYSFGAFVALRIASSSTDIASVVSVALAGKGYAWDFLGSVACPVRAIHPERDFATSLGELRSVLEPLSTSSIAVVPNADHFFRGAEAELARCVLEALSPEMTHGGDHA
jgi:alpha/beta superfamily hydrolase